MKYKDIPSNTVLRESVLSSDEHIYGQHPLVARRWRHLRPHQGSSTDTMWFECTFLIKEIASWDQVQPNKN